MRCLRTRRLHRRGLVPSGTSYSGSLIQMPLNSPKQDLPAMERYTPWGVSGKGARSRSRRVASPRVNGVRPADRGQVEFGERVRGVVGPEGEWHTQ